MGCYLAQIADIARRGVPGGGGQVTRPKRGEFRRYLKGDSRSRGICLAIAVDLEDRLPYARLIQSQAVHDIDALDMLVGDGARHLRAHAAAC